MDMEIIKTIASYLSIPIVVVILIGILIANAEQLMIIKGMICELFASFSTKASKTALSCKLRGCILKTVNSFDEINSEIIPPDLKIEWITNEDSDSFIKGEQVIVRVKKSNNPQENLITTTAAFVNTGLLHNYRRYLDNSVMKASNFTMIRKIVQSGGRNSLTYFEENYLPKYLSQDDNDVYDMYKQLRDIDKNGMFINILLRELSKAADTIYGDEPDPCLLAESRELVRFLYNIAIRETDDATELQLKNNYFHIAIILTAKDLTIKHVGIDYFVKLIKKQINNGYDTVYMLGIGQKIFTANDIAKRINEDDESMIFATHYQYKHTFKDGVKKDAVIYEISSKFPNN